MEALGSSDSFPLGFKGIEINTHPVFGCFRALSTCMTLSLAGPHGWPSTGDGSIETSSPSQFHRGSLQLTLMVKTREITTWMGQVVTKRHFCIVVLSDGDLRTSHMSRDWIQSQHNTRRAGCASLGKSNMRQQYWLRSVDYSLPLLASAYQKM